MVESNGAVREDRPADTVPAGPSLPAAGDPAPGLPTEDHWAALLHLCPLPACLTAAADGRFLDANARYLALIGYELDELVGRTAAELGIWGSPVERAALVAAVRERGALRDQGSRSRPRAAGGATCSSRSRWPGRRGRTPCSPC